MVAHVCYRSHTSVSPARVLQLCFKKLFCYEIKLAISAELESGQNTSGASILNSSGATKKVAALVTALVALLGYTVQVMVSILKFHCSLHIKLIYRSGMIYA